MKPEDEIFAGKLDEGKLHVQFDEGGSENMSLSSGM
jgi:hypothetical protein